VRVAYLVVSGTAWEVGFGTFNGTTTLTRDRVYSSSNAGRYVLYTISNHERLGNA
jgi:hypothetical protein